MIADLFLRTYPNDYKWVPYLFRSLERHARDWRDLVIVLPRPPFGSDVTFEQQISGLNASIAHPLETWAARFRAAETIYGRISVQRCDQHYPDDYLGQCVTKLRAWEFSDADQIAFLDSDIVLLREWLPRTLCQSGALRTIIEVRDWDAALDAKRAWHGITAELLGKDPPYETMARHPFQYPAQFLRRVWGSVADRMRIIEASGRRISEFNLLGNYAIIHEPDSFLMLDPDGPDLAKQFWSYAGITPEVEAVMRQLGYWED